MLIGVKLRQFALRNPETSPALGAGKMQRPTTPADCPHDNRLARVDDSVAALAAVPMLAPVMRVGRFVESGAIHDWLSAIQTTQQA